MLSFLSWQFQKPSASSRFWLSIPGGSRTENKAPALHLPAEWFTECLCTGMWEIPLPLVLAILSGNGSRCLLLAAPAQPNLSGMQLGACQCTSQIAGGKKHRWLADIPFFPSIFRCFVYLKDLKATSEMSLLSPDIKKIKRRKMVSVIISRISFVWGLFLGLSLPGNLLLLSVQRHTNEGAQK